MDGGGSVSGGSVQSVISALQVGLQNAESYFWTIAGMGAALLVAYVLWRVIKKATSRAA